MKSSSRVRPQQVPCSAPTRLVGRRRGAGTSLSSGLRGLVCVRRGALDVTPFDPRRARGWAGPALYMGTPRPGDVT